MEEIHTSSQAGWHPRGHGGLKTGGRQLAGWAACTVSPAPKASRCESPVALWRPMGQGGRLDRGSAGGRTWARGLPRSGPVRFPGELIATSGSPVAWRSSQQGLGEPLRCALQESRPSIACQEIPTDLGSQVFERRGVCFSCSIQSILPPPWRSQEVGLEEEEAQRTSWRPTCLCGLLTPAWGLKQKGGTKLGMGCV